jgi:hypothetical protein
MANNNLGDLLSSLEAAIDVEIIRTKKLITIIDKEQ